MTSYRPIRMANGAAGVEVGPYRISGLSDAQDPTPYEAAARRHDVERLRSHLPTNRASPEPTSKRILSRRVGPGRAQAYAPVNVFSNEGRARLGEIAHEATDYAKIAIATAAEQGKAAKAMVRVGLGARAAAHQSAAAASMVQAARTAEVARQAQLAQQLAFAASKAIDTNAPAAARTFGRAAEALARAKRVADASIVAQVKLPTLMAATIAKAPPQLSLVSPARDKPPDAGTPYQMYHGAAYSADSSVSGISNPQEIYRGIGISGDVDWGALVDTVSKVATATASVVDKLSGKTPTAPAPAAATTPAAAPATSFTKYLPYIAGVGGLGILLYVAVK